MAGLWDSVSKGLAEVSKKAGEIWDGVANVVAPVPGEDGHPPVATSGAREVRHSEAPHLLYVFAQAWVGKNCVFIIGTIAVRAV